MLRKNLQNLWLAHDGTCTASCGRMPMEVRHDSGEPTTKKVFAAIVLVIGPIQAIDQDVIHEEIEVTERMGWQVITARKSKKLRPNESSFDVALVLLRFTILARQVETGLCIATLIDQLEEHATCNALHAKNGTCHHVHVMLPRGRPRDQISDL